MYENFIGQEVYSEEDKEAAEHPFEISQTFNVLTNDLQIDKDQLERVIEVIQKLAN